MQSTVLHNPLHCTIQRKVSREPGERCSGGGSWGRQGVADRRHCWFLGKRSFALLCVHFHKFFVAARDHDIFTEVVQQCIGALLHWC